jgi:hypothetical protein
MFMPEYCGRGRKPKSLVPNIKPVSVEDLAKDESLPWEKVVLGNGSKGPVVAQDKCLQVVDACGNQPGDDIWLYIRRLDDGALKYSICNESMNASKEDIRKPALMRWAIEQCFKECKKYLGLDHYESRTWKAWRRHILVTLIAHLFLIKMRRKFSVIMNFPGPALFVNSPVPLDEYINATINYQETQKLNHPKMTIIPNDRQQILTIGLVRELISFYIPKTGAMLDKIENSLKEAADSYESFAKAKIKELIESSKRSAAKEEKLNFF